MTNICKDAKIPFYTTSIAINLDGRNIIIDRWHCYNKEYPCDSIISQLQKITDLSFTGDGLLPVKNIIQSCSVCYIIRYNNQIVAYSFGKMQFLKDRKKDAFQIMRIQVVLDNQSSNIGMILAKQMLSDLSDWKTFYARDICGWCRTFSPFAYNMFLAMTGENTYPRPLQTTSSGTKLGMCDKSHIITKEAMDDLQSIIKLNPFPVEAHINCPFYFPGAPVKSGISLKSDDLNKANQYIKSLPENHILRILQFNCGTDAIMCVCPKMLTRSKL